ncbi:hypothetical protein [Plantactinospora endophytica]|uniref:Uncharacterized protein n=1 Tax=Plantactinospora endophytica TaxID=673535 RepID=A0ABQ4DS45_9ACTN|nr:hypothetical protein [Plantactinospora endophytica]GIG85266.1 hypothetical protein Pen02_02020 [Plantactinospora endophytica]
MSTSADNDGRPDNGPFDGVPDLPPEWGRIVIPDDPAELAAEAAELRRELRSQARREGWRRRLGLPSASSGPSPLRLSLLIMSIALLATLTSLFAITWPGPHRPSATGRSSPGNPGSPPGRSLPALDLVGEDGRVVPLRGLLPAVIMLIDGCTCGDELDAAVRAVPPGVAVVAVSTRRTVPSARTMPPPGGGMPRFLTDPTSELRTALHLGAGRGAPAVVLAGRSGQLLRTVPESTSPADYQADLPRLLTAA